VIVDQAAKAAIESHLVPGQQAEVLGPVGLTLSHNEGIAFGLASGSDVPLIAGPTWRFTDTPLAPGTLTASRSDAYRSLIA
jgi:hypothetical protein